MFVLRPDMTVWPVFGFPRDLNPKTLPTYKEVIMCYLFKRNKKKPYVKSKEPMFDNISGKLAVTLE